MDKIFSKKLTFTQFLKFVSPSIISMVFISLYTIIDGIFVSKFVGSDALASINIVLPIISILCGIGIMFATGSSALISISMGEKKYKIANEQFSLTLLITSLIGIFISIFGFIFSHQIFTALGANEKLMPYCLDYGIIIIIFAPIYMVKMLFEYFTRTDGAFHFSLIISVLGGFINIIFDYVFICIFDMGIQGAALATILGAFIASLCAAIYFLTPKSTLKYTTVKWDLNFIKTSAINGSSEMVSEVSTAITTFLFNFAAMKFAGEDGIAAITIILYAHFLMTSTYLGFSAAIAPMISYNYGAKNSSKIKEVYDYSKKFILVSSISIFAICLLFAPFIVMAFVEKGSLVFNLALVGLQIFSFAFLFTGANIFASGLFTSFSNGKISALISFSRAFVFVILGFFTLPYAFGLIGVWLIVPFAEIITCYFSIKYLRKYKPIYLQALL